jgi:hypothetical protein
MLTADPQRLSGWRLPLPRIWLSWIFRWSPVHCRRSRRRKAAAEEAEEEEAAEGATSPAALNVALPANPADPAPASRLTAQLVSVDNAAPAPQCALPVATACPKNAQVQPLAVQPAGLLAVDTCPEAQALTAAQPAAREEQPEAPAPTALPARAPGKKRAANTAKQGANAKRARKPGAQSAAAQRTAAAAPAAPATACPAAAGPGVAAAAPAAPLPGAAAMGTTPAVLPGSGVEVVPAAGPAAAPPEAPRKPAPAVTFVGRRMATMSAVSSGCAMVVTLMPRGRSGGTCLHPFSPAVLHAGIEHKHPDAAVWASALCTYARHCSAAWRVCGPGYSEHVEEPLAAVSQTG